MTMKKCVIAIFKTHVEAEEAIKALQKEKVNMTNCSILGRGIQSEEEVVGFYNAGDRIKFWGKQGAFWGGVWGFLAGSGFFMIPGIGPVVAGGALVSSLAGAIEGAIVVGGLNIFGASLFSIGIPRNSILNYETAIKENKFLVIYHGTPEETLHAKSILETTPKELLELAPKEAPAFNF
jgi:hypothetical protein